MRKWCLLLVALPVLSAMAEEPAPKAEQGAAGVTKRCLNLSQIRQTKVLDNQNIIFTLRNGTEYLNTLPHNCSGLKAWKSFGYATGLNKVCDLDIITVLQNGRRGTSCGLGVFVEQVEEVEGAEADEQAE